MYGGPINNPNGSNPTSYLIPVRSHRIWGPHRDCHTLITGFGFWICQSILVWLYVPIRSLCFLLLCLPLPLNLRRALDNNTMSVVPPGLMRDCINITEMYVCVCSGCSVCDVCIRFPTPPVLLLRDCTANMMDMYVCVCFCVCVCVVWVRACAGSLSFALRTVRPRTH